MNSPPEIKDRSEMTATNIPLDQAGPDDVALAERMQQGRDRIVRELRKLIVGQDDVIEQVLISLFVGGNSIITGVPGLAKTPAIQDLRFERAVSGAEIVAFQALVRRVPVADEVIRYAVDLARTSRPSAPDPPAFVEKWIEYGASVRAAQYLVLGGKARAL